MPGKDTKDTTFSFDKSVTITVFGASGDLASKKTFPALFTLYVQGLLPPQTKIFGYARSDMSPEKFNEKVSSHFEMLGPANNSKKEEFLKLCKYVRGTYNEDKDFSKLNEVLNDAEKDMDEKNRLLYLALPPSQFAEVCSHLKKECYLKKDEGHIRVIIEKPFGHDLASSRELQDNLSPLFGEDEIYRIDHYLGKEMVKNLSIVRFMNTFMMGCWSNQYISNVQITFKEPFGTEGRGGYFDDIGIIRDVMQNHLLQVLSLVAMDRPVSDGPEDTRDEKVKVLRMVRPIKLEDVVLGQYEAAEVNGEKKPGYKDDDSIKNKDTKTPTYAAFAVYIDSERWDGVPFILKAGKALDEPKVEIRLQFKPVPGAASHQIARNELVFRVQPTEAIYLKMNTKFPGLKSEAVVTDLDLSYRRRFSNVQIPQAYESLILDCLNGDHSNFVRDDELDEAWQIITPLLESIDQGKLKIEKYPYGSRGPAAAEELLKASGYTRSRADEKYTWPTTAGHANL
uniref:Glucose-6-phosphate 1-dehydrogenase n=1 Tax=Starmerella bombicola TaxID=75736 RepID=A0A0U1YP45_STABO|nr:glucose-6-phosphate dehydrogenase [Starmerella bombicola]